MKTKQFAVVALLLTGIFSYSQGTFNKLLFENPNAISLDIIELKDSSYLLTGCINDITGLDLFLCNTRKNGSVSWTKRISNTTHDWSGNSILALENNEFIITGESAGDVSVLKINQYGDTLWTKKYGGNKTDGGSRIIRNYDNGFIISGFTYSGTGNDMLSNIYLLNLNSNGDTIWTKKITNNKSTYSYDIIKTSDGGYFITGYIENNNNYTDRDCYFLKINKNGNLIWSKNFGNKYYDQASASVETKDKGFIIAGTTSLKGDGNMASYILRLNESGDSLWTKTIEGGVVDRCIGVVQTYDSCFVFAGMTGKYPNTTIQAIKINLSGNLLWTREINSYDHFWARSIIQTVDSSIVIAGHSSVGSNTYTNLIRLDKNGELKLRAIGDTLEIFENLPKKTIIGQVKGLIGGKTLGNYTNGYKLEYTDLKSAIVIDPDNGSINVLDSSLIDYETTQSFNLYVKVSDGINSDLAHILVKIKDVDERFLAIQTPNADKFQIYPNPTSGTIQVNSDLEFDKLTIELYDINGKVIDKQITECKNKVIIDYSKFPKGLYCLKISTLKSEFSKTLIIK